VAGTTIRPATLDDAVAIARVHIDARRAAYAAFFPPEYLDGLEVEAVADLWRGRLVELGVQTLIAEADGRVVGQIRFGPAEAVEGAGEVLQLHILPDYWRRAIGTSLMATAIAALTAAGFREAVLNVYAENARARRFYERNGWHFDGFEQDIDRGGPVRQLRYRRGLPAD
jgi:ribosomal protein S18 acetylase RimI-like enzyme